MFGSFFHFIFMSYNAKRRQKSDHSAKDAFFVMIVGVKNGGTDIFKYECLGEGFHYSGV